QADIAVDRKQNVGRQNAVAKDVPFAAHGEIRGGYAIELTAPDNVEREGDGRADARIGARSELNIVFGEPVTRNRLIADVEVGGDALDLPRDHKLAEDPCIAAAQQVVFVARRQNHLADDGEIERRLRDVGNLVFRPENDVADAACRS